MDHYSLNLKSKTLAYFVLFLKAISMPVVLNITEQAAVKATFEASEELYNGCNWERLSLAIEKLCYLKLSRIQNIWLRYQRPLIKASTSSSSRSKQVRLDEWLQRQNQNTKVLTTEIFLHTQSYTVHQTTSIIEKHHDVWYPLLQPLGQTHCHLCYTMKPKFAP